MTKRINAPCERASREIIPVVKNLIANNLYAKGYTYKQIGEILGVSATEINYLIRGLRGTNELRDILKKDKEFTELVESYVTSGEEFLSLCPLCSYVRRKVLNWSIICPYDI
ncbi:transcriptional regulator [Sulfolobus acidocaldarius]|uniref:Uncharacterized protein n=4 Tax=Sulfolobus acidocaldarius TaxID=2285 RepID=Q4JCI6_SULAC|nr:hypothetical protein [Sulfolobus acidocaldarius]AAY79493.1 hypothetical protein Saci_0065 [Sulfolobus acidocaldarius DSM 639]AGE70042.1 hypothetical protein SacN8_00305 [Sulfolobus acidocaldarius N8]AGE72317.1 hypothetical protein SacRon12I_00305 [Sulfolobus acidocaldarius Ron12/I]ALU29531.1 hypothetical protein ATY89_05945 [Sulfolobus acidocaldarius]ALU32261.1 hypothetical protein ATZ20_08970 [Sulfolobus acidocaldarius]